MTHLLRAFCVDVLQRVLCLLLVVPHDIGVPGLLPCLGVYALLDGVDVRDVVLPGAWRWAPRLLDRLLFDLLCLFGALGARGRGGCLAFGNRGASLALGARLCLAGGLGRLRGLRGLARLLGAAANVVEVLLQHVGRRLPALVSAVWGAGAVCSGAWRTCLPQAPRCGRWLSRSPAI